MNYHSAGILAALFTAGKATWDNTLLEAWAAKHFTTLSHTISKPVRTQDCMDDRLAVVLSKLGDVQTYPGMVIEADLGQHLIRAYTLPTDTAQINLTTVSVYHQPQDEDGQ